MSARELLLTALFAGLWAYPVAAPAQAPGAIPVVEIVLRPQARADGPVIRIGHVAEVEGGDARARQAIAGLDLAEFGNAKVGIILTSAEVKFRLLVAGHAPQGFRLAGAAKCVVRPSRGAVTEAAILEAARKAILERIPQFADHVAVKAASPIPLPVLDCQPRDRVVLTAALADGKLPLGRTNVSVTVTVNGQNRAVVTTCLDVSPSASSARSAPARLATGTTTPARDPMADSPVVVRSRERVKLIARMGEIQIIAAGEAQQDGRLGQSIRVRNVDSSKMVQGRVVGPGVVHVDY